MTTDNLPAIRACRPAWNKGRIVGQKRPLQPKHVWAIRVRLEIATNIRDLALFNLAIDSKLRGCDLVKLKVADVYAAGQVKERASIIQSKTKKPVRFEITEGTRKTITAWLDDPLMIGSEYLWPGRFHERLHISTRQYARLVRDWVTSIGLEPTSYGTHTMRRTKVAQIYRTLCAPDRASPPLFCPQAGAHAMRLEMDAINYDRRLFGPHGVREPCILRTGRWVVRKMPKNK